MIEQETQNGSPALEEASRELQAAQHDARVAFDCIALGELDRAHTHAPDRQGGGRRGGDRPGGGARPARRRAQGRPELTQPGLSVPVVAEVE